MFRKGFIFMALFAVALSARGAGDANAKDKGGKAMEMTVKSSAFDEGGMIPKEHTCDGRDTSPPLSWSGVPEEAKSLALICDDPDAPMGTWVHWVLYDLPADIPGLSGEVPPQKTLEGGGKHGINDFRKFGYGGPCPPGGTHRYYFRLYALDITLEEAPGLTKKELLKGMKGHIIGEAKLMGRYAR